ncbi:arylsulfatase [Tunturiibacter gelidoferens]|uniref:Arylsulfatase n=2 Tax=Tunturiibacter TaxID=3154218 RepID=A0A7Y9NJL5_9BACT|nr:arylsulfatase [Edaphobacter lichenicola]NYF50559.1 arylsulfatase [Edaphobacter lichenicola]
MSFKAHYKKLTPALLAFLMLLIYVTRVSQAQPAQTKKPNIVVIMTDDVGIWNISAYHRGMMGGSTPNIDRIAKEGALFTDYYAQQSCTAGRAAFITGQTPFRTGLLMVGLPGAKQGLQDKDPTIAELLKPEGYATAQIGKNHLGDRNEYLPTVHGFDEFYGILYHLNAMEEPYAYDYPKMANFKERFGPRNVISSTATSVADSTTDPRWGTVGKQKIVDEGPLPPHPNMDPKATTNMEDIEPVLVKHSTDFMERSVKAGKPFFLWHNSTRMHVWTHLSPKWQDKSGFGLYADGMMELDWEVGELLKKIDDLGIADNTIVLFTSDNGPEIFTWPDGGNQPFRGEKGVTYEGGFRVPMLVKWPGVIKPNTIVNDIMSMEDWLPTLVAAAGDPDMKDKLLKGVKVGDKTFKTHLDGYNFIPYFKGEVTTGPRHEFFYFSNTADLMAMRYDQWKVSFKTIKGNLFTGEAQSTQAPIVTNLRQDPWERYQDESMNYGKWWGDKLWTMVPATVIVSQFLETFKEYPPSQKSGGLTVTQFLEAVQNGASGAGK